MNSSTGVTHNMAPPSPTAVLEVTGMKCAGCVQAIEKHLSQQAGVQVATVNLVTQRATVAYEPQVVMPDALAVALTEMGFPSQVQPDLYSSFQDYQARLMQQRQAWMQKLRQLVMAVVLVVLSGLGHLEQVVGISIPGIGTMGFHWGLATIALLGPGREILVDGAQGLWRRVPNMNSLVGLGSVTAYIASVVALVWPALHWECFFDAPVMIVGLILLGRVLEAQAREQTTAALDTLLGLQPATAQLLPTTGATSDPAVDVPVAEVPVGAHLRVLPGDKFPVDGVLLSGITLVDESMLTGEPVPVQKSEADQVAAGTLNQSAVVTMRATRTGAETTLAQIIQLIETAQTRKAPIQRLVDVVAGYFTYGVIVIALLTFLFWAGLGTRIWPDVLQTITPMVHAGRFSAATLAPMPDSTTTGLLLSLKLAIAVLVVACPCALGLATPTAILVGTSLGAQRGVLIRGGDSLEQVHKVDTVVFDKTGTLTTGTPVVTDYWVSTEATANGLTPDVLLQIAATVESGVRHPLATALLSRAQSLALPLLPMETGQTIPGCGVAGQVEGEWVQLGTDAWLTEEGVTIATADQTRAQALTALGQTVLYVAIAGEYRGAIAVTDTLKPDAVTTVTQLQQMGLQVKLLTGDQWATAMAIAQSLGLPETAAQAQVSPTQKAAAVQQLQTQGHCVAMVGDGINDAPALAQADVGIALSSGTDVAVETAQIILMQDQLAGKSPQLSAVVDAIQLSRATFAKIQQNLFWALGYNLVGIPIAAGVLLPRFDLLLSPGAAAAFMAFSSVSVVTNSLLLRQRWT